ncbi:hypothetical protein RB595_008082 [Gaeumannomyces hyphopodioides]
MLCRAAPALSYLLALPALISGVQAGWNPGAKNNLMVYWGQNAGGGGQPQDLKKLCDDPSVSVIAISFLADFKPLKLNLASNEAGCTKTSDGLIKCPTIEKDIKYCQGKQKTILLSLAGGSYEGKGWASAEDAKKDAAKVFDLFGPVGKVPEAQRPFGSVVMNGFDFDFEKLTTNLLPFAQQLRKLADGAKLILGAAPQCVFPDAALDPVFSGGVKFDLVAIQFYNNPGCGLVAFKGQGGTKEASSTYNFEKWATWAKTKGQGTHLLVGAPATEPVGGGSVSPEKMKPIIEYSATFPEFAGVMVWEATAAIDSGFLKGIAPSLAAAGGGAGGSKTPASGSGKTPASGGSTPKKSATLAASGSAGAVGPSPSGTFDPSLTPPGLSLPESQKPLGGAAAAPGAAASKPPVTTPAARHRRRSLRQPSRLVRHRRRAQRAASSARRRSQRSTAPIRRRRVAKRFAA